MESLPLLPVLQFQAVQEQAYLEWRVRDEAEREERRLQKEEKAREAAVMGTPYRSPSGRKSMHSTAVDEEVVAKISQIISLAQENVSSHQFAAWVIQHK